MKILSGLLILSATIIVGCGGTNSSTQTGTLIEPTVTMNSDSGAKFGGGAASKALDIQTNLPFEFQKEFGNCLDVNLLKIAKRLRLLMKPDV